MKLSLMTDTSSSVVITVFGPTSVPTLTRRKPMRPAKPARITVSARRARAASSLAMFALMRGAQLIELGLGERFAREQILAASEPAAAVGDRRFRFGHGRSRLIIVELDQYLARPHHIAFIEADGGDFLGNFRRHVSGLVGRRGSHRFQLRSEWTNRRFGRHHLHPSGRCDLRLGTGFWTRTCAEQQGDDRKPTKEGKNRTAVKGSA